MDAGAFNCLSWPRLLTGLESRGASALRQCERGCSAFTKRILSRAVDHATCEGARERPVCSSDGACRGEPPCECFNLCPVELRPCLSDWFHRSLHGCAAAQGPCTRAAGDG